MSDMRKRTFMDRKFSAGDANSDAYRDSWDRMFGTPQDSQKTSDDSADKNVPRGQPPQT